MPNADPATRQHITIAVMIDDDTTATVPPKWLIKPQREICSPRLLQPG
jgi:hypothetical protein